MERKDFIIIGAGPAGLSAAVYGLRAGMDLVILDSNYMAGGQVLTTYEVDNYLGMPGMNGFDMGMKFKEHAEHMGAVIKNDTVVKIEPDEDGFTVKTTEEEIPAKAVLLATGAVPKKLEIPGEKEFAGAGVGYCATCDGAFYRGRTTAVIGGSYQAVEDAIYLAGICKKVYLIHRRDKLRAGAMLEKRLMALENVEIVWNSIPTAITGKDCVEQLVLSEKNTGEKRSLAVDGVFVAVGTVPKTELIKDLAELDSYGYVKADENGKTSLPGLYAAGDIRTKQLRQIVTAVADGANAATAIMDYINVR